MSQPAILPPPAPAGWVSPVAGRPYDRTPALTPAEQAALAALLADRRRWGSHPRTAGRADLLTALQRLVTPVREAIADLEARSRRTEEAVAALVRACGREGCAFWGWDAATWQRVLGTSQAAFYAANDHLVDGATRHLMVAAAYRLGCFTDIRRLGSIQRYPVARRVFGPGPVDAAVEAVVQTIRAWGYAPSPPQRADLAATVSEALLLTGSPHLHALTAERLAAYRRDATPCAQSYYYQLGKALAALGVLAEPLRPLSQPPDAGQPTPVSLARVPPTWAAWVQRWEATSTLTAATRRHVRIALFIAGRWLAATQPAVTSPDQWTREVALAYVAAVDRMTVGAFAVRRVGPRLGQPLSARTKDRYLRALRAFFQDCQAWEWLPRRFDPQRAFRTPRSVTALIGPAPRTIADDLWAKLLWAGLNLTQADLPAPRQTTPHYPLTLVRALAATWLVGGLRGDEIVRLRVGCVRWLRPDAASHDGATTQPTDVTCLLDVPVHKTGTALTKPVDPVLGQAIAAWEAERPAQPAGRDPKTGEQVDLLFCLRAQPVPTGYFNRALIPLLCAKAGVASADARGPITSHRARATIASQLYNARDPMSLSELQAWLGHRSPASTQHYVAFTPTRLAQAYADAGYFARNVRAIEVLIDQEAITTGAAAAGRPWRYYDLGHGLCTYEFFDQCPHRLACARCDFYRPKASSHVQLLEARGRLLRLRQEIPLSDEECAAVDGDVAAFDRLLTSLADRPTPRGPDTRRADQARN
jgi:integrase